jgi:hypothetical protein
MGDDRSAPCEVCGEPRGGINDFVCRCDLCKDCGYLPGDDNLCACTAEGCWNCDNPCCQGWQCRLRTLAANLATAAGLCRAFRQGTCWPYYMDADDMAEDYSWSEHLDLWRPGCALPTPSRVDEERG